MKTMLKGLAIVLTLMFVWAAAMQYNDPDALWWIFLYGVAALASVLFLLGRLPRFTAWVLMVGYLIGAVVYWPQAFEGYTIGEGDIVNIEEARESSGLIICAIAMLIYALFSKTSKV